MTANAKRQEERVSDALIEDARRVSLRSLVARVVKLKIRGKEAWGQCPFHQDKTPSFKVEANRYHCFGCGADGGVIDWVMVTERKSFVDAVRHLTNSDISAPTFKPPAYAPKLVEHRDSTKEARAMWDGAVPIGGTHAEAYLKARKIRRPASDELRFAERLAYHPPMDEHGRRGSTQYFPALIARISDDRGFCAVQRIYLDPVEPRKAKLPDCKKSKGLMRGGAVRLQTPGEVLGLAEGLETSLSVIQLYQITTWSTCGTARILKGSIDIPPQVRSLVIFGDAGDAGRAAAFEGAEIYERKGYPTEVIFPSAHFPELGGDDFNTVLQGVASEQRS